MTRPLKYLEGKPIETIGDFAREIKAGRYIIVAQTGQRVNPGWARSWQFSMCLSAIRRKSLLYAIPNPEHPDNKEQSK